MVSRSHYKRHKSDLQHVYIFSLPSIQAGNRRGRARTGVCTCREAEPIEPEPQEEETCIDLHATPPRQSYPIYRPRTYVPRMHVGRRTYCMRAAGHWQIKPAGGARGLSRKQECRHDPATYPAGRPALLTQPLI